MTTDECVMAIRTGMDLARQAADEGYGLVAVGEMGIGNTTASSAVMGALLGLPADAVAGRGTGISDFGLGRKIEVIEQALAVNQQRLADPVSILAAVGGFEVAGIAGFVLGCAKSRLPVIIDGFISSVATAVAIELNVVVRDYCFFSHVSREKAHRCLLTKLRAEPLLDLGLCLGEGTGAVLAMALIESAVNLYNEMSTFGDAGVSGQAENLST
jgi:nicotinate-nucleotide--dimethylbenzimidazole phosphoribosyltransferase